MGLQICLKINNMETFKAIFAYLLGLGVLAFVVLWVISIDKGYGPFFQDMNSDGVITYKDFFVRLLSPAGNIFLDMFNPILDSNFGKFFEASAIEKTNKAMAWSGLFFYVVVLPTCMNLVMKIFAELFNLEDAMK